MGILFQVLAKTESQAHLPLPIQDSFGTLDFYFKIIFFLFLVLGVAFLCIKYILPRLGQFNKRGKSSVRITGRIPLDGRKSVYVLELHEGKEILIGTSDNQVNFLCELEKPDDHSRD